MWGWGGSCTGVGCVMKGWGGVSCRGGVGWDMSCRVGWGGVGWGGVGGWGVSCRDGVCHAGVGWGGS